MMVTRHASFTIERAYPASPARVFAAWADLASKQRWFRCADDWVVREHTLDFRVGGREVWRGGPKGGTLHANDTVYCDIVPDRRIVYSCDMHLDEAHISVSLMTVLFTPEGKGTRLSFTEQGAFLDGYDDIAGREEGTRIGLENLAAELA